MNITASLRDALIDFIYEEAQLIDEKRFDEWFALFADDGMYWIPLSPDQNDALNHASLMYEDRLMLKMRIERLKQPRVFSQQPESRCLHVLQRPTLSVGEDGVYRARTPMIYVETRGDEQWTYAATVLHDLVVMEGRPRIRMKRVDLLNCDSPLPAVQLFF